MEIDDSGKMQDMCETCTKKDTIIKPLGKRWKRRERIFQENKEVSTQDFKEEGQTAGDKRVMQRMSGSENKEECEGE